MSGDLVIARAKFDQIEKIPLPEKWRFAGIDYDILEPGTPDNTDHYLFHGNNHVWSDPDFTMSPRDKPEVVFREAIRRAMQDGLKFDAMREIIKLEIVDIIMDS